MLSKMWQRHGSGHRIKHSILHFVWLFDPASHEIRFNTSSLAGRTQAPRLRLLPTVREEGLWNFDVLYGSFGGGETNTVADAPTWQKTGFHPWKQRFNSQFESAWTRSEQLPTSVDFSNRRGSSRREPRNIGSTEIPLSLT